MSYATTPPPAGYNSVGGLIGLLILVANTFTDIATVAVPAGAFLVSAMANVASDATLATTFVGRITDGGTNVYMIVAVDVPAGGNQACLVFTPRRIVLPAGVTLHLQVETTTGAATAAKVWQQQQSGVPGSWLFAEPCS